MKRITSLFLTFILLISLLWCNPEAVKAAENDGLDTEVQEVTVLRLWLTTRLWIMSENA